MQIKVPLALKIAVSLLLLAFVLTRIPFSALGEAMSHSNPYLVLLATLLAYGSWFLNTYKWQILLSEPGAHLRYLELVRLTFIGIFYNLLLPGQVGGEVVKAVSLMRMGVGKVASAVSVVADRVTGLLAIFLLGLVGVILAPEVVGGQSGVIPWLVAFTCGMGTLAAVLVTSWGQSSFARAASRARFPGSKYLVRAGELVGSLSSQTRGLSSLAVPLLLSIAFQLLTVLVNLILCISLGISVSFEQLLWVVAVVSLLQALPISIAGIGVREGAYVYLLQQQGVSAAQALALSLTVFAIQIMMGLTGGALQLSGQLRRNHPPEALEKH